MATGRALPAQSLAPSTVQMSPRLIHAEPTSNCTARRADPDAHSLPSGPVLGSDSRHAAELAHIVGYDDQPLAAGMPPNLHVVRAAGHSRTFQFRPNLAVVRSRFDLEWQHFE